MRVCRLRKLYLGNEKVFMRNFFILYKRIPELSAFKNKNALDLIRFVRRTRKCHKLDNGCVTLLNHMVKHYYRKYSSKEYAKYYKILEIPNDSDQECVRKAFIDLCKKYHPDSGNPSADALKFQEIESAYRALQNKFAAERWNVNEGIGEYGLYYKEKKKKNESEKPEVFDIKHTAPQHRQYLSYDGIGSGTPSQREKQFVKYRTVVAAANVYDHQVKKLAQGSAEPSLVVKDKTEAKKIKTQYGIERLVEDLIQESIAKGQFDNLKGQGKPLPASNYNPYVDFVTHKVNEILIDNGFTPEWITLQKEISEEIQLIREKLTRSREKLGPLPLNVYEEQEWKKVVGSLKQIVAKLNQKINKYNLLVPVLKKQKIYFNLEKESCDILDKGNLKKSLPKAENIVEQKVEDNFMSSLLSIFK